MAEAWTQWEGSIVNGVYPLRRFLNASDHSSVFLTESTTEGFLNAAIKLIAADPRHSAVQLWQWKTATTFSHPHLLRLLDFGQCEIGGRPFLFVVMEYAEENLSQILPYRALGPDEVRELLVPTLDALASLHRENWVQGQLKPANFLVVNDQLKLAMDTIRSAGIERDTVAHDSLYDPPECARGEISLAADIWALGVTLVEALTQYPPTWPQGKTGAPSLPANLPPVFLDIIQRCLSVDPAERPTVAELQVLTKPVAAPAPREAASTRPARQENGIPAPAVAVTAAPQTPQPEQVMRATPPHTFSPSSRHSTRSESGKRSVVGPALAALAVVVIAVWGGLRVFRSHPTSTPGAAAGQDSSQSEAAHDLAQSSTPSTSESSSRSSPSASSSSASASHAPASNAASSSTHSPTTASSSTHSSSVGSSGTARTRAEPPSQSPVSRSGNGGSAVVHEEIPKIPQSARQTIRGHVRVSVRVTVNRSGNVVHDTFENASSSKYFNRMASEAARKWKFASADNDRAREWLLHFEFGRESTTVHASRSRS